METNVIALNRTRPESWTILIRQNHDSFISCVFDEKSQVWAGGWRLPPSANSPNF